MRPVRHLPALEPKDKLESALHDLTNGLAAARAYADVLALRAKSGPIDPALAENILRELDTMNAVLQQVRRDTYRAGDTLRCLECGYTFVNRKAAGRAATCRRCNGSNLERWKATP